MLIACCLLDCLFVSSLFVAPCCLLVVCLLLRVAVVVVVVVVVVVAAAVVAAVAAAVVVVVVVVFVVVVAVVAFAGGGAGSKYPAENKRTRPVRPFSVEWTPGTGEASAMSRFSKSLQRCESERPHRPANMRRGFVRVAYQAYQRWDQRAEETSWMRVFQGRPRVLFWSGFEWNQRETHNLWGPLFLTRDPNGCVFCGKPRFGRFERQQTNNEQPPIFSLVTLQGLSLDHDVVRLFSGLDPLSEIGLKGNQRENRSIWNIQVKQERSAREA